jgi:hypothetical protein
MNKIIMTGLLALLAIPAWATAIPTLSGGIGDGEQEKIEAAQKDYSLKVIFSAPNGDYLSDVRYVVRDEQGGLVTNGVAAGPFLLLGLPVGNYVFEAELDGKKQSQKFKIGSAHKVLQFRFPD